MSRFLVLALVASLGCQARPPARSGPLPPNDLPEPESVAAPTPFSESEAPLANLAPPSAPEVKPLPPAAVPTLAPSRRLGDRKFIGPHIVGPMSVSADGRLLAFAGGGGMTVHTEHGWRGPEIQVWDVAAGRTLRTLTLTHNAIRQLELSPDGQRLYAGGSTDHFGQGTLRVWDVTTGKLLKDRPVALWALSRDGKTLATVDIIVGTFDRMSPDDPEIPWRSVLTLWNTADLTVRKSFQYTSYVPRELAIAADGSKVACGRQANMTVFDAVTGKPLLTHAFQGSEKVPFETGMMVFAPDGKSLVVGDRARYANPRTLRILDLATKTSRILLDRKDRDNSDMPELVGLAYTPDSRKLVAGFKDVVLVVDAATGELPPLRAAGPGMQPWQKQPRYEILRRGLQPDDMQYAYDLALSRDGKTAYLGGWFYNDACGLRVVDVATRDVQYPPKPLAMLVSPFSTVDPFPVPYIAHDPPCPTWMKLPGGRELRWQSYVGKLTLNELHVGPDEMLGYVVTPDGETLITRGRLGTKGPNGLAADDPQMRFRDGFTGKDWGEAVGPTHPQIWNRRAMAISPDGRTLAALHPDGGVWLWEVATTKPRLRLDRAGPEDIYRFAFSRDGRHLISNDNNARTGLVWDLDPDPSSKADLASLWNDLIGEDAAKAYQAIGHFAGTPAKSVPFLRERTGQLPVVKDATRLAARPFDRDVVLARRAVEALERCGTAEAAKTLRELEERYPYANPAAAADRIAKGN